MKKIIATIVISIFILLALSAVVSATNTDTANPIYHDPAYADNAPISSSIGAISDNSIHEVSLLTIVVAFAAALVYTLICSLLLVNLNQKNCNHVIDGTSEMVKNVSEELINLIEKDCNHVLDDTVKMVEVIANNNAELAAEIQSLSNRTDLRTDEFLKLLDYIIKKNNALESMLKKLCGENDKSYIEFTSIHIGDFMMTDN